MEVDMPTTLTLRNIPDAALVMQPDWIAERGGN
jgi:hypothetical protein